MKISDYGPSGRDVVRAIRKQARDRGVDLDPSDLIVVDQAARLADRQDQIRAELGSGELLIQQGTGSRKPNGLLAVERQNAEAIARLLARICWPDDEDDDRSGGLQPYRQAMKSKAGKASARASRRIA